MPRDTKKPKATITHSPYFINNKNNDTIKKIKENKYTHPNDMPVPDNIDYDLKVLFVGINPGLMSAAKGHHFAGPTNHFWPCLSASGLVDKTVTFYDDINLPTLYRLGITNLTMRSSQKASDLTLKEQRKGIPILTAKFRKYRPKVACFVGKGIYEIYMGEKCKQMGLQTKIIPWNDNDDDPKDKESTQLFVMPSTSGIVSAYQKPDKIKFFQQLCQVVNKRLQEETNYSSKSSNLTPCVP